MWGIFKDIAGKLLEISINLKKKMWGALRNPGISRKTKFRENWGKRKLSFLKIPGNVNFIIGTVEKWILGIFECAFRRSTGKHVKKPTLPLKWDVFFK